MIKPKGLKNIWNDMYLLCIDLEVDILAQILTLQEITQCENSKRNRSARSRTVV